MMNFNKRFKGQVDVNLTQNVLSNPLIGITTTFDGVMVESNKRMMVGFSTSLSVLGVAGINTGIIVQPNQIYDYPFNQIRQIGLFTTELSCSASFILYDEEI